MRTLVIWCFTIFAGPLLALPMEEFLERELRQILSEQLPARNAVLTELDCGSYYDGIACIADLVIQLPTRGKWDKGPRTVSCRETIAYRGDSQIWVLDSTCP